MCSHVLLDGAYASSTPSLDGQGGDLSELGILMLISLCWTKCADVIFILLAYVYILHPIYKTLMFVSLSPQVLLEIFPQM